MGPMSTPTIADEVERYVRTGDADMGARAWPGDILERGRRQHGDLRGALVEEVRRLAKGRAHEPVPANVGVEFTRAKVEAMVRGLFARAEQDFVLATLEKSVIYVTIDTIEPIILNQMWDRTAWDIANLYLLSVGARLLGKEAPRIVGLSEETTLLRLAGLLRRGRRVRRLHRPRSRAHLPQLQATDDRAPRDAHEGVAARYRVQAARDVRLLVRGLRPHRCAREEPRRAPGAGGRVWLEAADLGGARGPGRGGGDRRGGSERAERMEGDLGAVRADHQAALGAAAGARDDRRPRICRRRVTRPAA